MSATKQQIRQIIADNSLNSVADVYSLLKDSFNDILQELMEAELDASFGYEKIIKWCSHIQQTQRIFFQNIEEPVWRIPDQCPKRP